MVTFKKKIEAKIRRKRQEIQSLEEELRSAQEMARELSAKIQAAEAAVGAFEEAMGMAPPARGESDARSSRGLRPGTLPHDAHEALQQIGKPTHISELLRVMKREVNRKNRTSLAGSLSAYVRDAEIFTRPAPNTFGLVAWEDDEGEEEAPPPHRGNGAFIEDQRI